MGKKVIVLGSKGMLGSCVYDYFDREDGFDVFRNDERFPSEEFFLKMDDLLIDEETFVVNCVGAIPQKTDLFHVNWELPFIFERKYPNVKFIHPSTDCEFSGQMGTAVWYTEFSETDAKDPYGVSKKLGTEIVLNSKNGKAIRSSIIGLKEGDTKSFVGWLMSEDGDVTGYSDQLWNGVTTLEWCKACKHMIKSWETSPKLAQISTKPITKGELAKIVLRVFGKKNKVIMVKSGKPHRKTLAKNFAYKNSLMSIWLQLLELKNFFLQ